MIDRITSLGTAGNLLTTIYYKNGDVATTRDFKTFERYTKQSELF